MIQFYYSTAPNPMKVALMLEETGLAYEAVPVDTRKGEQFDVNFLKVNPNAKVPALIDGDAVVFDSNAILLYLGDKTGQYVPPIAQSADRANLLSWLMFVASGIGPFSGQSVHFRHVAPEPKEYALNRFDFEAHRHWSVVENHLDTHQYLLGDDYSIVDMSLWAWARMLPFVLGAENPWDQYPNIKRLLDAVSARPAADKAIALSTKHTFKTEMDADAKRFMFPQNERLGS